MKPTMRQTLTLGLTCAALLLAVGCPNLVTRAIGFTGANEPVVSVSNLGDEAPAADAGLFLSVDSHYVGVKSLSGWSGAPGSTLDVTFTGTRVMGQGRRFTVVVDRDRVVDELEDLQQSQTRLIDPPYQDRGDLKVDDLWNATGPLWVRFRNVGIRATAITPIELTVRRNGSVIHEASYSLPPMARGVAYWLNVPSVNVAGTARYAVTWTSHDDLANGDTTNDGYAEFIPTAPDLSAYHSTMSSMAGDLLWEDAYGAHPYGAWPTALRTDFDRALIRIMEGKDPIGQRMEPLFPDGPSYGDPGWYGETEARAIFAAFVAHSIWIEVNRQVPWSLLAMTSDQRREILDGRRMFTFNPARGMWRFGPMARVSPWSPQPLYRFMKDLNLIGVDHQQTVMAFAGWVRGYVRHTSSSADTEELWDWPNGFHPPERVLYARPGEHHRVAGCWGGTGLFDAVLRTVNIPVVQEETVFGENEAHSRFVLPTLGLTVIHTDDLYTPETYPMSIGDPVMPSEEIFLTLAEYDARIVHPPLDCVGGVCNTVGVQAKVEYKRWLAELAQSWMSAGQLYLLAHGTTTPSLYERLTTTDLGYGVVSVAPLFTDAEADAMIAAMWDRIRYHGGVPVVFDAWGRFDANQKGEDR